MSLPYELSHYSDHEVVALRPREPRVGWDGFKPQGLWVSVDGEESWGWREWCRSEDYPLGRVRHRVDLREGCGILVLDSVAAMLEFTDRYEDKSRSSEIFGGRHIDWKRVMREWPGILIPQYQWSLRMDLWWYYPWDCASGCIWDVETCVQTIEPVECVLEGITREQHKKKMEESLAVLRKMREEPKLLEDKRT